MDPELLRVIQTVLNGLVLASSVSLAATGLTLSYGVTRFINFAYGEFLTYGAYFVWALLSIDALIGIFGLWPTLIIASIVSVFLVCILSVSMNRVAYEPLRDRGPIPLLITSLGVAFVLRYLLQGIVGSEAKSFSLPLLQPLTFEGASLSVYDLLSIVIAVVVLISIHSLLSYTMLGKKMRAVSGNETLARIAGLDIQSVIRTTWIVSAGIGALAGILLALRFAPFTPTLGWSFLLVVFAATILGGIGKPYGAMLGSIVIAMAASFGAVYLDPSYQFGYSFAILVIVLLVRPEGIRGGEI